MSAGNRLSRNQIIMRGLNQADILSLKQKEMPGDVLSPNAMSIDWLQEAMDLFHRSFPWTGIITTSAVSMVAGTDTYALPTRFIQDVRNGLLISQTSPQVRVRLLRKDYNWLLSAQTMDVSRGTPGAYVIKPPNLVVYKVPDTTYSATLHFYQLPVSLEPNEVPNFPDDWTLVEYIKLKGKEWAGEATPDTAMSYARRVISELLKSGLGIEAATDSLQLDPGTFRRSPGSEFGTVDWLTVNA